MIEKYAENDSKSLGSFSKADLILIFIFIVFFLMVIFDLFTPAVRFFFEPTGLGQSWYSLASSVLILFTGLFWGVSKIKDQIKAKNSFWDRWQTLFSKASNFVGMTQTSGRSLLYILLSMFIGVLFNFLILYGVSVLIGGSLHARMPFSETYLIMEYLVAGPLSEELVFRGIYLSSFLRIFGRSYPSAALGLIMSSFTFGWIHPEIFLSLIIKTSGGFLLGIIYMFRWKKNFMAAFSAHFGFNLIGIVLYVS